MRVEIKRLCLVPYGGAGEVSLNCTVGLVGFQKQWHSCRQVYIDDSCAFCVGCCAKDPNLAAEGLGKDVYRGILHLLAAFQDFDAYRQRLRLHQDKLVVARPVPAPHTQLVGAAAVVHLIIQEFLHIAFYNILARLRRLDHALECLVDVGLSLFVPQGDI